MKKLITLLAIVSLSLTSFGQDLTNQFYFRVGYSSPSWSQYGMDKDNWDDGTSKVGATFELGSIFMLKGILNSENMSFGINADYLHITYGNFSMGSDGYDQNVGSLRVGSKVGPSFTYSPMDKMAIDVYAKADIAWASAAVIYEDEPSDADDYFLGYGAVGFSTGLNFRYGLLMLGIEFNTISPKLESDDIPGWYFGNPGAYEDSGDFDDYGEKTDLPCVNFTIGMSF